MNMTKGKPVGLILRFAIPLIIGNLLQQFYAVVDTVVVGRGVGISALASLGAADWINWFMLWVIQGITQGFAVLIAQRFGADDRQGLKNSVTMSAILSFVIGVILTVIGLALANPILRLLNTPDNIIGGSWEYLQIIFSGTIIVVAYNMVSCVLRSLGDSKTPLSAMIIAAAVNIALDILFVLVFGWGIRGAAIATIIAQLCSFLYCLWKLCNIPELGLEKRDWKIKLPVCKKLLQLGIPMGLSMAIIAIGGMVVQFAVNGQGFLVVAGFTATNKLYGVLECASFAFGFAMSTYMGQNYGARRLDRIQTGMKKMVVVIIAVAWAIGLCMIAFGRNIVGLFISGNPTEALQVQEIAYRYLFIMSCMLFVLYLVNVYRASLQGLGCSAISSVSGIIELIMRVAVVVILPRYLGESSIFFAEVSAWMGAAIYLISCFYWEVRRISKTVARADTEIGSPSCSAKQSFSA